MYEGFREAAEELGLVAAWDRIEEAKAKDKQKAATKLGLEDELERIRIQAWHRYLESGESRRMTLT